MERAAGHRYGREFGVRAVFHLSPAGGSGIGSDPFAPRPLRRMGDTILSLKRHSLEQSGHPTLRSKEEILNSIDLFIK